MKKLLLSTGVGLLAVLSGCKGGEENLTNLAKVPDSRLVPEHLADFKKKILNFKKECFYDNSRQSSRKKPSYSTFPRDFKAGYQHYELVGMDVEDNFPVRYRLKKASATYRALTNADNGLLKELNFDRYDKTLLVQRDEGADPETISSQVQRSFINAPIGDFEEVPVADYVNITGLPENPLNLGFFYYSNVTFRIVDSNLTFSNSVPHRVASGNQSRQRYVPPYYNLTLTEDQKTLNFVYMSHPKLITPRDCAYAYDLALIARRGNGVNQFILDPGETNDGTPPPHEPPSGGGWP